MEISKSEAINSLGTWRFKMCNESLSEMTFYEGGKEISKPSDFPSDKDINARYVDMQTKLDAGSYGTVQELIATY
tara:strand:- start:1632 stop:1856 length:225 start_codon:yes stop_codon:yes gene_type:complete